MPYGNLFMASTRTPRQVCWHAHQTVEKALKVALIFLQIDFQRTHDLNVLQDLLPER